MAELTQDVFTSQAEQAALTALAAFRTLNRNEALKLPEVEARDIVVAGKEVQLAVFRQTGLPGLPEAVLVVAQISRAGMGGIIRYQHESGLVFLTNGVIRDATEHELAATGG